MTAKHLSDSLSSAMHTDPLIFTIFLIFTGAAALATLALYTHQAMLVAYIY